MQRSLFFKLLFVLLIKIQQAVIQQKQPLCNSFLITEHLSHIR